MHSSGFLNDREAQEGRAELSMFLAEARPAITDNH